ncbi:hypothetical protein LWI28_008351 [Acer negundo]|uniref:Cyclic nucleotide-binding domain-containing protein n=1 Tax=Acer negundo TaxID=4023 RepID=A0AAD5NIY5_ACENE|nr:hypothetical protein LWI28_008351 [Acer negundo]
MADDQSTKSSIMEPKLTHPLHQIAETPTHKLLLKQWLKEEELNLNRISFKETQIDSVRKELTQLYIFFFLFHSISLILLFNASSRASLCHRSWIPSVSYSYSFGRFVKDNPAVSGSYIFSLLIMSQFVNLEEGTSGQLPTGHRNGTNTVVSGHIQRDSPENSDVEVQGRRRPFCDNIIAGKTLFHGKKILIKVWPLVNIFPFIWCANKISIDPFNFYRLVINYDKKCVEFDNTFLTVDRYLRPFSIFIICGSLVSLVRVGFLKKRLHRTICFLLLLIDLGTYFPNANPWLTSLTIAIWPAFGLEKGPNFYSADLFLLQYFLTIILLYIMFTRATRTCAILARATWAKAAFNLLLYIHGGHVFGGLWYAFAIDKEIDCWMKACERQDASECPLVFFCDLYSHSQDYKFINEFCPTKTQNKTAYDFGIYHDALESGIVETRNFPMRVLHCFRWGLQNLSGFGQNIQTSTDAWENIFVISITIYGMMLFVFFIGNMQIYLQSQTNKSEMIRQRKQEIEQSKSFEKLPKNLQKQIKKYQPEKWEETKGGVEFGNLFNNLPDDLRRNIQCKLCLELLKKLMYAIYNLDFKSTVQLLDIECILLLIFQCYIKVEEFRSWSEELLDELCDCAKPVSYAEHAEIVRRGSSIDEMLFLMQGKLRTYSLMRVDTSSAASPPYFETSINHLEDGEFCGEELVAWFQADLYSSNLPISTRTIQTIKKVDAFSLMSYDLQNVFIKHRTALSTSTQVQVPPVESQLPQAPPPPTESPAQQPASGI